MTARRSATSSAALLVATVIALSVLVGAALRSVPASAEAPATTPGDVTASSSTTWPPLVIGAVFPQAGDAGALAAEELRGIQIAVDLVNADGGVNGQSIALDVHGIDSAGQAPAVLDAFEADGVQVVLGAYSSELSIPVSAMVSGRGMVYWETGAVADRLTDRGLANVFRVGASSATLGMNSGTFALQALAPMLGRTPSTLRVALVSARDDYASGVAAAADRTLTSGGASIVARLSYPPTMPVFDGVLRRLAAVDPDVIVLASHIPDGIVFRQQMIAAGLHTGALIGTTMAECVPDFARPLGADAVGIFGSDRPSGAFDPSPLSADARSLYDRFAQEFEPAAPQEPAASGEDEIGELALEEGVSGFSAAWALLHDVLPLASTGGSPTAASIATAAQTVDLPLGSLPNGGGLSFSRDPGTQGQNERAIGLIQQWQAPNTYAVVWPPSFATAPIRFVPLPR